MSAILIKLDLRYYEKVNLALDKHFITVCSLRRLLLQLDSNILLTIIAPH